MVSRPARLAIVAFGLGVFGLSGCTKGAKGSGQPLAPVVPEQETKSDTPAVDPDALREQIKPEQGGRVTIPTGTLVLSEQTPERIDLTGGAYVPVEQIRGEAHIGIVAVVDDASFAQMTAFEHAASLSESEYLARLDARLEATAKALKDKVPSLRGLRLTSKFGFFAGSMKLSDYQTLNGVDGLPADLVVNPLALTPQDGQITKMDRTLADELMADGRLTNEAYSGLARMGVPEFLTAVSAELGVTPNGRNVKVGVTDTGVTFNHPAFLDDEGESRVVYMKDFTGEGRLYFNPAARLSIATPTPEQVPAGIDAASVLVLDGQAVAPVAGAITKPVADQFVEYKSAILVSDELKAALTAEGAAARLGLTTEAAFKLEAESVDLNQNGKNDDQIVALLVQTEGEMAVYVTVAPQGQVPDFRQSPRLRSWNASGDVQAYAAERFGFDIATTQLASAAGEQVAVVGASIVGFDPGNHGTHVSGIIAGRKTIANDSDATLARGAAPAAPLMVDRVCANNGGCSAQEAIVDLARNGAELINMSLGGLNPFNDGYGVQDILVDRISQMTGTLFVISAGNSGPGANTVGSPSVARKALSVGATATRAMIERQYQYPGIGKPTPSEQALAADDFMLFFSSRGPTAAGGFKPEITAPGTELSSIQLNSAPGANRGLEVYWGTSMAAPSATGAIALLLDAAKLYNAAHPETPLPIDGQTLKRVAMASARPFDVDRFDPATGAYTRGQFTWIDQGTGMLNLPAMWAMLKAERDARLPSALKQVDAAINPDVALDYQIRVLRTGPNGIPYDGTLELPPSLLAASGPRFGRGIWLDAEGQDSLIQVQVARRLPQGATSRPDFASLTRLLPTTQDRFELRTVFYGSNQSWLAAGSLQQLNCAGSAPAPVVNVTGLGAVDNFTPEEDQPHSLPLRDSLINVCIDRAKLATLPAGDHGALIAAYRTDGTRTEATPSFTVPVYVVKTEKTLAGAGGYRFEGSVQAFGVARHYIKVPEGISVVTVKLEIPEGACQGARLYAHEAQNTRTPKEIEGNLAIAANCDDQGRPTPDKRIVTYSRTAPAAGIWDLHVLGRYQFALSQYTLTAEYAKVSASVTSIAGGPAALDGSLSFTVQDASFDARPSSETSTFKLDGFLQAVTAQVTEDAEITVPDANGTTIRSYDATVATVEFSTSDSTGNDIDLYVSECDDAAGEHCKVVEQSGGATDVEHVSVTPVAGKFYKAVVAGYKIEQNEGRFKLSELRRVKEAESGTIAVEASAEHAWTITHAFAQETSALLATAQFTSGAFKVVGDLVVKSEGIATLVRVPVEISNAGR